MACGSTEHKIMDCPKVQSRGAPSTPRGSGVQKKTGATGKAKVPARIYAIDRSEVDGDAEVLEGTLTISGNLAKVLIDPGSTHTFARPGFRDPTIFDRSKYPNRREKDRNGKGL